MKTVCPPPGRIERLPGRGGYVGAVVWRCRGWGQLRAQWPGSPQLKHDPWDGNAGAGVPGGQPAWEGVWGVAVK